MQWPSSLEVRESYDQLTSHIVPGPRSISYFIPVLSLPVILLLPPTVLSLSRIRQVALPIIYSTQIYVWVVHKSFDVISINHALLTFMLLGWYDVRKDFKYVRRSAGGTQSDRHDDGSNMMKAKKQQSRRDSARHNASLNLQAYVLEPYPSQLWPRLKWVGTLCASLRLTDWHIGMPSHDARQPSSIHPFQSFLLNTLAQATLSYVLLDFTSSSLTTDLCLIPQAGEERCELHGAILPQSLLVLGYLYSALTLFTSLLPNLIAVCALYGLARHRTNQMISPLTWPSHMGPFSSIFAVPTTIKSTWGLRAFWGMFWHQNMRYMTSTPGIAVASLLKLPDNSAIRYMTIITSSFFWSGVVHMGVVPPAPKHTQESVLHLRLRLASFFWLQIVGITVEVMLQRVVFKGHSKREQSVSNKKVENRSVERSVVAEDRYDMNIYLWTIATLTWTVGFLAVTAWWTIWPVGCVLNWWGLGQILPSVVEPLTRVYHKVMQLRLS